MRTILIDPYTKTITEVDYNGDYQEIQRIIQCDVFCAHSLGGRVTAFLDDSGNWKQTAWFCFNHPGASKILYCGRMLVSATNPATGEGMELPSYVKVQDFVSRVQWLDGDEAIAYAEQCDRAARKSEDDYPEGTFVIHTDTGLADRIRETVENNREAEARARAYQYDNLNNPNDNCLDSMACPRCGSLGEFRIEATDIVTVDDQNGITDREYGGEWNNDSFCRCVECDYAATVAEFLTGEAADLHWRPYIMAKQGREWLSNFDALLAEFRTERNTVWVYTWSRDCDQMEGDGIAEIAASLKAFWLYQTDFEATLEGPGRCHIISPSDAELFEPTRRDRAAEQMNY